MRRNVATASPIAALLLFGMGSASANVIYSFDWVGVGSFVYQSPSFITTFQQVPVVDLTSCSTAPALAPCGPENFIPDINEGGGVYDDVEFGNSGGFSDNYFDPNAFTTYGVYTEQLLGYPSTLTVEAATPVPEPLTRSLFGTGLAAVVAMRRRRAQKRDAARTN